MVSVAFGLALLGFLLYGLRGLLTPLIVAFAIAYVLDPVVDRLEAWRIPRALGILAVMLVFVSLVVLSLILVIPRVVSDVAGVIRELPAHANRLIEHAEPWLASYGVKLRISTTQCFNSSRSRRHHASSHFGPIGTVLGGFWASFSVRELSPQRCHSRVRCVLLTTSIASRGFLDLFRSLGRKVELCARHDQVPAFHSRTAHHGDFGLCLVGAYTALASAANRSGLWQHAQFALISAAHLRDGRLLMSLLGAGFRQLVGVVIAYAVIKRSRASYTRASWSPTLACATHGCCWRVRGGEILFHGRALALPAGQAKVFITVRLAHRSRAFQNHRKHATSALARAA